MEIYMTHPQHGAMHVYSDEDAKRNIANGWERTGEPCAAPAPVDNEPPQVVNAPVTRETLASQYEAKFGRKPHHKMLPATIQAALDEK